MPDLSYWMSKCDELQAKAEQAEKRVKELEKLNTHEFTTDGLNEIVIMGLSNKVKDLTARNEELEIRMLDQVAMIDKHSRWTSALKKELEEKTKDFNLLNAETGNCENELSEVKKQNVILHDMLDKLEAKHLFTVHQNARLKDIVPLEMAHNDKELDENGESNCNCQYVNGWNACRDSIIQQLSNQGDGK